MLAFDLRARLRDFAFEASGAIPNGVTVVLGPSGAGKSTLLRFIAGLQTADSGSITLAGRVLYDARTNVPPQHRNIGVVFQEYALFPHLDVAANVAYGLRARALDAVTRADRVNRALALLDITALRGERVTALSGGQRQRVALARALAIEPAALLLDEPLSALDPRTRERVRGELRTLFAHLRIPILLVTHDDADRAAFSGPTLEFARGRIVHAAAQLPPIATIESPA
jgi:ABC-type sulfate/molybdate transport systems ATPase subunit